MQNKFSEAETVAESYYDSSDADKFYEIVWGGEDIHIGLYEPGMSTFDASRKTVEAMARALKQLNGDSRVLDLGAGYGGAARYLAARYGCQVTCLNLSEVENERNRRMNVEQGLDHLINVTDGSFEDLPFQDNMFTVIWSQDAFLHSGDRERVLQEAVRVLKSNGHVIFTDPMAADGCSRDALTPILTRLNLDTMATPNFYRTELDRLGLASIDFDDNSEQLPQHYQRVHDVLEQRESELDGKVSEAYRDRMKTGLRNWVNGGRTGNLAWGIFHARS